MVILALDISTKTGYAVLSEGKLTATGVLRSKKRNSLANSVPFTAYADVVCAESMGTQVRDLVLEVRPDYIYIEQTNKGQQRGTQKLLEFLHFASLKAIATSYQKNYNYVKYIDTSRWRSIISLRLTKEQKKHNKLVKEKKARGKITTKHLAVTWANTKFDLKLKLKDNDIADACCMVWAGYQLETGATLPVDVNKALNTIPSKNS